MFRQDRFGQGLLEKRVVGGSIIIEPTYRQLSQPTNKTNMSQLAAYKFRYTLISDESDAAVLKWVASVANRHLVVQHDADSEVNRTHWHAVLYTTRKLEAIRLQFKRQFPDVEKAGYGLGLIKEGEADVYERYMCHGACDGDAVKIIAASGLEYSQAWAQAQNTAFYAKRREFTSSVKKQGKESTVLALYEEATAANVADRGAVADLLIQMYVRQRRPMIESYMKAVITTVCVMMKMYPSEGTLRQRLTDFF